MSGLNVGLYRIKQETPDGDRWLINIVLDDPEGVKFYVSETLYHGILLDKETAEEFISKMGDGIFSLVEGY